MTILIQHNQYYFRKISIDVKSQGSQARMIGTVISIIGGMSMTYYKGPVVKQYSPLFLQLARPRLLVFTSTHENWVLGCFLFATASLALCAWNIIQAGTIRKYPQVMKIVFLYTLFGTIQSAIFAFVMEKDLNAWRLKLDMELLVIVLTVSPLIEVQKLSRFCFMYFLSITIVIITESGFSLREFKI
ncbi:hypothetical protein T459_25265 [Capsicum annuum]|uniref:WAT1-related protein n=1 Tax=Capsicum annuum TaxID=4072 RepID=A0A2G2YKP0_CAPAN|nr:hypothetical protein T459_25265 [Capsicum annuum]